MADQKKITIAGFALTYLQLALLLAAVVGLAYKTQVGPFKPSSAF
jgi:hypothetical protein